MVQAQVPLLRLFSLEANATRSTGPANARACAHVDLTFIAYRFILFSPKALLPAFWFISSAIKRRALSNRATASPEAK